MVELYAKLIIAKKRTIDTVPKNIRDAVVATLKEWGYDEKGEPITVD